MFAPITALALCAALNTLPPERQQQALQAQVVAQPIPISIYVMGGTLPKPVAAASGFADQDSGRKLTSDTPLRIASNTKTFVAAAVLRLHERGRIDLDAAIAGLLDPELVKLLSDDGYKPDVITVRQLLSHSAGLYDHGSDPRYIKTVLDEPRHVWSRKDLVRLSMQYADPQAAPGVEFRYSDTGYILLGDILERVTGQSLATAVRHLLRFDALGLTSTWWEVFEQPPPGVEPRARQFIDDIDATDVHASFDLYGGGGLVMSTRDLAHFMAALFEGRVFEHESTLRTMLRQGTHKDAQNYRLGMLVKQVDGREVYFHSGFWGTVVYYDPATRLTVAAMTTRRKAYRTNVVPLVETVLGVAPLGSDCIGP